MSVPIEVRVTDRDSENFLLVVRGSSVPVNSTLYGANNSTLAKNANGDYVLTPADVAVFRYQAPLHWSDVSIDCQRISQSSGVLLLLWFKYI